MIIPEKYITVLMPAYNMEAYISEAIESILVQTFADFEFLIIDDGSTDRTWDIIESYQDPRIRLIRHEKNMGIRATLNEGIELASYELIARMDADDISHPWRLEKEVDYMRKHPECAMISTFAKVIDDKKNVVQPYDAYQLDPYYAIHFDCYICHPTVLYRKSCVKSVGMYSKEFCEDFDLWWKLSRVYNIYTIDEPLLLYRKHDKNFSRVSRRKEYDLAEFEIIKRNFKVLLGNTSVVPEHFISCYNYNFDPIIENHSFDEIIQCLEMLDKINNHIISIENPNRHIKTLTQSIEAKKRDIIKGLVVRMPFFQMIRLLFHCNFRELVPWAVNYKLKKRYWVARGHFRTVKYRNQSMFTLISLYI